MALFIVIPRMSIGSPAHGPPIRRGRRIGGILRPVPIH